MLPEKIYVIASPGSFENTKSLGHDFMTDPVSFNDRNFVAIHGASPSFRRMCAHAYE
jgi:hypothetical protein